MVTGSSTIAGGVLGARAVLPALHSVILSDLRYRPSQRFSESGFLILISVCEGTIFLDEVKEHRSGQIFHFRKAKDGDR